MDGLRVESASWPPREVMRTFGVPGQRGSWYRRAPWPDRGSLDYVRLLVTVTLLLLALPWLVNKLLTNPGAVLSGLGQRAAGRAVS